MTSVMNRREERQGARRGVLIAYALITAIGLAFVVGSYSYTYQMESGQVGPGYLPRFVGGIVIILGVLLVIQELRGGSVLAGDSGVDESRKLDRSTIIKLVIVFALMALAVTATPLIGIIPSLAILVAVLGIFVEKMPKITTMCFVIGASVGAYIIFIEVLNVPLPMGIFGVLLA